jgi:hypothetical protein
MILVRRRDRGGARSRASGRHRRRGLVADCGRPLRVFAAATTTHIARLCLGQVRRCGGSGAGGATVYRRRETARLGVALCLRSSCYRGSRLMIEVGFRWEPQAKLLAAKGRQGSSYPYCGFMAVLSNRRRSSTTSVILARALHQHAAAVSRIGPARKGAPPVVLHADDALQETSDALEVTGSCACRKSPNQPKR